MKRLRRARDAALLIAVIAYACQGAHFTAHGAGVRVANAGHTFAQSFRSGYNAHIQK